MAFEDPELIRKYITEIKKFTDLDYYKELKKEDKLQYEFSLRDVFPTFAESHPFLFRKIVMGDDLTFLYLDSKVLIVSSAFSCLPISNKISPS